MRANEPAGQAVELLQRARALLVECRTAGESLAKSSARSEGQGTRPATNLGGEDTPWLFRRSWPSVF